MVYGYARVSTSDQNLDRQKDALEKYGIDDLYCEKMSGTKKNRPELDRMLSKIQDAWKKQFMILHCVFSWKPHINFLKIKNTYIKQIFKGVFYMFRNVPDILTTKQCQELLKIGKKTMLYLLKSKKIEAFKIGSRWKIPKESVIEYITYM